MRIHAATREEYFANAGQREPELRRLDALIQRAAPSFAPTLVSMASGGVMLGYGLMPYRTKSTNQPTEWPVIALAAQKNYLSLYVSAVQDGRYVAELYQDNLGKVSCGKSCIRFKKLDDLNLNTVQDMLRSLDKRLQAGDSLYAG